MTNLKAVIPVAGLGMHMLPATKAIPKEMLPIVDKPMIQYIVDEIVAAGIKEILLVTHASKNAVENHFDTSYELESLLEQRVKRQLLAEVQSICPPGVTIMNVRQGEPLGLGHSILCARPAIGDNPFVVVLPDVVIDDASADPLRYNLAAMIARFNETGRSQVLAKRMPGDLSEYSVIQTKEPLDREGKVSRIVEFIEKPDQPHLRNDRHEHRIYLALAVHRDDGLVEAVEFLRHRNGIVRKIGQAHLVPIGQGMRLGHNRSWCYRPNRHAVGIGSRKRADGDKCIIVACPQREQSLRARLQHHGRIEAEAPVRAQGYARAGLLVTVKRRRAQREAKHIGRDALVIELGERLQLAEIIQNRQGLLIERLAERRGMHAAALAHEQALTQLALEVGDGLRHRLHGYVLPLCSRGQAAVLDDRGKVADLLDIQRLCPQTLLVTLSLELYSDKCHLFMQPSSFNFF